MGSMPLALSVHNFISSVGADAGFAALVGLAILVLLYFAHARDTANLQEEAEELAHRLLQAETRLAQLSRQAPAPAPAPAPAATAPGAAPAAATAAARAAPAAGAISASRGVQAPAAPAGVGAPALAAATHVVPVVPVPPDQPAEAEAGVATTEPAPQRAPEPVLASPAQQASAAQGAAAAAAPVSDRPLAPGAPQPATAAGAANGGGGGQRVATVPGGAASPPRERVQIRTGPATGQPRRPTLPPRGPAPRRSGGGRRVALVIGALVVVAAIAALVVATQTGGGSQTHAGSSPTTNLPAPSHNRPAAPFNPSSVTVAVLNGTATNELAHRVAAKLTGAGYRQGAVATAASQAQSATVVAYLPGFRNDALHVATTLKLGPASVQAIDSGTRAVACPQPSPCTANVVVTVGADLATL